MVKRKVYAKKNSPPVILAGNVMSKQPIVKKSNIEDIFYTKQVLVNLFFKTDYLQDNLITPQSSSFAA